MRIVMVSSRRLGAATRGDTARLLGFASALAPDHDVTVVAPDADELDKAGFATGLPRRRLPRPALAPMQVLVSGRWSLPRGLAEGADVLHVSTARSFPLVPPPFHARCHVDFVDSLSRNMSLRGRAQPALRPLWSLEATLLHGYERRVAASVRTSSAISVVEAAAIHPTTATVPNGVWVPDDDPGPGPEPLVVFSGNLGYYPNTAAAMELATRIFPLVRASRPEARLRLVGARPPRQVRALAGVDSVEVLADVPTVSPHLHDARAIVAPIRTGTGVQTKVLEGMAHGRPVVTTAECARGIAGALPGEHVVVAGTSEEFASAVVDLLDDRERSLAIGRAARELMREHHGWAAAANRLLGAYEAG